MTGRVDPSTWPLYPPESWFDVPDDVPDDVYCNVITSGPEAGRVFGRVHHAGTNLLGAGEPWTPPPSPSGLHDVQLGITETAEGNTIRTANIGGRVNHAPLRAGYQEAIKHYENIASQTMRVRYHQIDTPSGPALAYSGAMWPDVTEIDVARVRASALSGDWRWRPEYAGYDFCGSQLVTNPGLPLRRVASVDDDHPPILVCDDGTCSFPMVAAPDPVEARLNEMEDAILEFADLLGYQVDPAPHTAAICGPVDRLDEMECALAELVMLAAYDEELHPRDETGKWSADGAGSGAGPKVTMNVPGLDPALHAKVQKTMEDLTAQYPGLGPMEVKWGDPETFPTSFATKWNGGVILNEKYWKDTEFVANHEHEFRGLLADSSVEGVIIHEFGHILDGAVLSELGGEKYGAWLDGLGPSMTFNGKEHPWYESSETSTPYGMENSMEAMAEAFSMSQTDASNPSSLQASLAGFPGEASLPGMLAVADKVAAEYATRFGPK